MQLTKIKNLEGFEKDETTGAILSVDKASLIAYKQKKKNSMLVFTEINTMKEQHLEISHDINIMKQELKEMKELITQFLSSHKG
jgi:hypothetical protein